jgi:oleate hydratase
MYYSNGNYEAFAIPEKPEGVDEKSAYIVGSGLAALATACFLVRDGQMKGEKINILEMGDFPGGACDGYDIPQKGYVIRGGREMEDHFECLWDLFRSIPSLEVEGISVLDEYYRLNKKDPNYSLMRAIRNRGEDGKTDNKFSISEKGSMEIMKLFFTKDEDLYDKKIEDVFTKEVFDSNFWLYWRTMFAFKEYHSALEMKYYIQRFIHHIKGLPDLSALKFTKYNQYESLILPMIKYLEDHGVNFSYGITVRNVLFDIKGKKKIAKSIIYTVHGDSEEKANQILLSENDLVFITNGSNVEASALGSKDSAPVVEVMDGDGKCWDLWRNIASQDRSFGRPNKYCTNIKATKWESATVTTLDDRITPYIKRICKRDPASGKVVTGGIVTVMDSNWLMSFTINRQPHFKAQPKEQLVIWVYGLYTETPGNYIKKPMEECTGDEIVQEWLYHLGVPEFEIKDIAEKSTNCIPCMMPYVTTYFMPRKKGDRPKIVPNGSVNFAFIGQFADTPRDTVFTTEYSVRTAMESVYTLLNIDRGVPEVFGSCYDIRTLLNAGIKLRDGKKITEMKLPFIARVIRDKALKAVSNTVIGDLLKRYGVI